MRKCSILYCPKYEISLEMFAKASSLGKPFLISLSDIFSKHSHLVLYRLSNFIKVGRHYKIKFIIASMAKDIYSIRDPEEIASILRLCGMTREQTFKGLSLLQDYIE